MVDTLIQNIVYGLTTGSIYALIALGFSLIFRTTGLLSFAHPQIMMIGGMIGYSLLAQLGLAYPLAAIGCAFAGAIVAVIIDAGILAPIRRRQGSENNLIVATIGVGIVLTSAATLAWGPHALPYPQHKNVPPLMFGGIAISLSNIGILLTTVACLWAFQLLLNKTNIGLAMRAASVDPATASIIGIPVDRTIALSFALSGALAGIAGILLGVLYFASFEMGATGLKSLCAAVIGGFGSLPGAVVGGLLLGILEAVSTPYISSQFNEIMIYGMLIAVLLFMPQGLFGVKQREV